MPDRVRSQRRLHGSLLQDLDTRRQRSGPEIQRQVFGFLQVPGAADLPGVADRILDHRNAENLLVEHDGGTAAEIRPRVLLEPRRGALAEGERGHRVAQVSGCNASVWNIGAADDGGTTQKEPNG